MHGEDQLSPGLVAKRAQVCLLPHVPRKHTSELVQPAPRLAQWPCTVTTAISSAPIRMLTAVAGRRTIRRQSAAASVASKRSD